MKSQKQKKNMGGGIVWMELTLESHKPKQQLCLFGMLWDYNITYAPMKSHKQKKTWGGA